MEVYRETSAAGKEPLVIGGIVLVLLLAWLGWVGWNYARGTEGLGSLIYVLCFFGLFLWRYAFRYTCILTDREFVVLSAGLGIRREIRVGLDKVESFATRYRKKFFRRTGIKRYIFRYSAADYRPTRILVFTRDGKMEALLFKAGDEMVDRLRTLLPGKIIDFEGRKD